jgi:hypothetical protein
MTFIDSAVLQLATFHPRVAEEGLAQGTAAQARDGGPRAAQRTGGNHAVRENHDLTIAGEHDFTDIGQLVGPQLQGSVFVTVGPGEAEADRANGKIPAALPEPLRQRALIGEPAVEFARQKERVRKPALCGGLQFEAQCGLPGKNKPALSRKRRPDAPEAAPAEHFRNYFWLSASSFFTPA